MSLEKIAYDLFQQYSAPAVLTEIARQMEKEFIENCDDDFAAPYRVALRKILEAENALRDTGC